MVSWEKIPARWAGYNAWAVEVYKDIGPLGQGNNLWHLHQMIPLNQGNKPVASTSDAPAGPGRKPVASTSDAPAGPGRKPVASTPYAPAGPGRKPVASTPYPIKSWIKQVGRMYCTDRFISLKITCLWYEIN